MIDANKVYEGVVGKNRGLRMLSKDSDKDGVMNAIDCQPFNPKKQGIIHRAAAWVAERRGNTERAEELRMKSDEVDARRENAARDRQEARREVLNIKREERQKQRMETARFREQERGRRQRESIKQTGGGTFGGLAAFGQSLGGAGFTVKGNPTRARRELGTPASSVGINAGLNQMMFGTKPKPIVGMKTTKRKKKKGKKK